MPLRAHCLRQCMFSRLLGFLNCQQFMSIFQLHVCFTTAWHSCLVPEIIYGLMWMIWKPRATERFLSLYAAVNLLQATKSAVGGDKLPPPITPEHNPLSVPGQDQLNGNELNGHPSNEGGFSLPISSPPHEGMRSHSQAPCSICLCLCTDVYPARHFCRRVFWRLSRYVANIPVVQCSCMPVSTAVHVHAPDAAYIRMRTGATHRGLIPPYRAYSKPWRTAAEGPPFSVCIFGTHGFISHDVCLFVSTQACVQLPNQSCTFWCCRLSVDG